MFIQRATTITNHPFRSISLQLWEDGYDSQVLAGISVKYDWSSTSAEIGVCENWCTDQATFQFRKGRSLLLLPGERHIFPAQLIERFSNAREPTGKPPVIASEANNTLKLFDIQWHVPSFDSFNLLRICPYSFRGDNMSQKSYFQNSSKYQAGRYVWRGAIFHGKYMNGVPFLSESGYIKG